MEEKAFSEIAVRLRGKAVGTALACGLDAMQADDVAQDALLKLWNMRDQLGRYRSLEALTVVMTRHLVVDSQRRRQSHATVAMPDNLGQLADSSGTPQEQLEELDNDTWLQERLDHLPDRQRSVLYMRQVEHRDYDEIARLLGIATTSARTLVARARKSLFLEFKQRMQQ